MGMFCKVWSWWGEKFGYVEFTPQGEILRFTVKQSWAWLHSPRVLETCDGGPSYTIEQPNWFDGMYHEIFLKDKKSGNKQRIGSAKHHMDGLDVGASFFSGVNANLKYSIVFKGVDAAGTVLGMAYQWYNHDLIANFGASNWAVSSFSSAQMPNVSVLPSHVVAYTAALYDLEVGSDRRRRSSHRR